MTTTTPTEDKMDRTGQAVSYEDIANPRRTGRIVGPWRTGTGAAQWWLVRFEDGTETTVSEAMLTRNARRPGIAGWRVQEVAA